MTNEEMIAWAKLEPASDFIWHANKHNLARLIWIARLEGRRDAFQQMAAFATQLDDAETLSSYPGGFIERKPK